MSNRIRKAFLFALMIAFLLAPALTAHARGKGFKDVVKHIETNYRAKKTRIPFLGLANFAVKVIRPAGVKGFKLAVFEDEGLASRPELAASFGSVMREAYNKDWMPLVQINSRRGGNNRVYIYAKYSGKDVEFALASFEEREAVVLQVKFNPDAAARFLENPKIMGISLGGPFRGSGGNIGTVATRTSRRGPSAGSGKRTTSGDRTIAEMDSPDTSEPKPRPTLKTGDGDENNPPILPPLPATTTSAAPVIAPAVSIDGKVAANPATSAGTTDPRTTVPGVDTIRIETRLVNLNVKAMDRAGQPITNLKLQDFVVYEDGVKQTVEHFKPVNAPVNVVLLIDLSGSTRKRRRAMADAAKRFIDSLPLQDKISVVAFTRRYRALTGFTKDKVALKNAVEQINDIDGGTAFYDSLWKALDDLDRVPDARKAVVVLTDGEDESLVGNEETNHTFEDLLGRASEEDVTIYPIYFKGSDRHHKVGIEDRLEGLIFGGGNLKGNDKVRTAWNQLDQLAEATGGEVVNAQREEDLESAYQRVAQELHMLYSLGYLPDKMKHDGGFRKISVNLTREDSVAKTRKGYFDR